MPVGYWCPVLHAHLPYVRHPEYPEFLEEDWFFEALTETYVPLVIVLDGLLADGVDYRLTMTLSPPLLSMMRGRAARRALPPLPRPAGRAWRSARSSARSEHDPRFTDLARFYPTSSRESARVFRETYGSDLVRAFRKHRDAGKLEIITCGATHGFLPLMDTVPQAVRAQVQVAAQHYRRRFGRDPVGHLAAGVRLHARATSAYLREAGLRFSFLESHGLTDAHPRPSHGVHAPIMSPGRGRLLRPRHGVVAAGLERGVGLPRRLRLPRVLQGRGLGAAPRVPGRRPRPTACARTSGIKYYRVTGKVGLGDKQPYDRPRALEKAAPHAGTSWRTGSGRSSATRRAWGGRRSW